MDHCIYKRKTVGICNEQKKKLIGIWKEQMKMLKESMNNFNRIIIIDSININLKNTETIFILIKFFINSEV